MAFFYKAKNLKLLALVAGGVGVPVISTVGVLAATHQTNSNQVLSLITHITPKNNPVQKLTNPDLTNALPSFNDQNLKDLPPNVEPVFTEPTTPKVTLADPHAPTTTPEGTVTEEFTYDGLNLKVQILKAPQRQYAADDIKNGIANRVPYRSEIIDEIVGVEVTPELQARVLKNAQSALSTQINGQVKEFFKDATTAREIGALVTQNQAYYDKLFEKYQALFDNGDKVKEFLTDKGKQLYPDIIAQYQQAKRAANQQFAEADANLNNWYAKDHSYTDSSKGQAEYNTLIKAKDDAERAQRAAKGVKYVKLLENLDFNKFKPSSQIDQDLKKGLTIEPDDANVYVDANGNINSYSRTPLTNGTIALLTRDNAQKRAFGISGYFGRAGDNIEDGNWPGWTKTDITTEFASKYDANISAANGISVDKYVKNANNKLKTARSEGVVVTVDVANSGGYHHIKGIIDKLKTDNVEITGYRIKNIGLYDDNQQMSDIIAALPQHLPLLEVWVESPKGDTSGLNPLENKQIDELSVFTHNNSLRSSWSIDPWALKGVAWVNTMDYNVSSDYGAGARVVSRVTFNYLSFADSDYKGDGNYSRINKGLRMAYWVRNNEKVFQGYFGGGIHPDRNASGNSYILGIDLSHVSKTRSLKGLIFYDTHNRSAPPRKLKWIKLYSDSSSFSIPATELNDAQFDTVLDTSPMQQPKSNISFGNGVTTTSVTVTGNGLTSSGLNNLRTLLLWSENFDGYNTIIYAPDQATYQMLINNGFYKAVNHSLLVGS